MKVQMLLSVCLQKHSNNRGPNGRKDGTRDPNGVMLRTEVMRLLQGWWHHAYFSFFYY